MKIRSMLWILMLLLLGACARSTSTSAETGAGGLPNPASENCIAQGGTLQIETRGDQGQFGVCYFEDNRQCEEWALMRGDCPASGLDVTGYITSAARYCAITGGEYTITGNSNQENEQGTCYFKDGSQCDALGYFNGTCRPLIAGEDGTNTP